MKKPNIILVMTDQHNGRVVHSFGDPWVRTPNMDRLAGQGVSFEETYCNSPLCVPSRCSMLAGRLPHNTGIFNNNQCLPSDKATFVHSLSAAGYETVLSGRMHFQGPDQRHGYEKRFVGDITTVALGISFGKERYGCLQYGSSAKRESIECAGKGESAVMAYDQDVVEAACDYMRSRKDERPLFLTVGVYGPHNPYVAPEELYDYYYNVLPQPELLSEEERERMHPFERHFMEVRGLGHETQEEIKRVRAAYYSMVEYEDRLLGKVMDTAGETMNPEHTLIIYTSDHGDCLGQRGMFWKSNMREGALRVPMIASWKNQFPEGVRLRGPASLVDLAPTLLEIAAAPALPAMDGESLLPSLREGTGLREDKTVISEICDIKGDAPAAMLRRGKYKLVLYHGYEDCLFDMEKDSEEIHNLSEISQYKEIHDRMKEELLKVWDSERICRLRKENQAHIKLLCQAYTGQHVQMLYDEWKQEGEERNQNYLIIEGKKVKEL